MNTCSFFFWGGGEGNAADPLLTEKKNTVDDRIFQAIEVTS